MIYLLIILIIAILSACFSQIIYLQEKRFLKLEEKIKELSEKIINL